MATEKIEVRLPALQVVEEGIRDCVRKIATPGDDHQRGLLLAGGVAALCGVLRKMIIPHTELAKISTALKNIRDMPEGAKLWEAYKKSGQDPIKFTIDTLKLYAEGGGS